VSEDIAYIHVQSWHRGHYAIYHHNVYVVWVMESQHALPLALRQKSCQMDGENAEIQY
jgi:hypothetical protein